MPLPALDAQLANDKYRAVLRSTWIADPADGSIAVTAIPANLPTYVVVGWNTIYETVFKVESTSGTNSSDYALTSLTVVKGAGTTTNLPEGSAVNCLNNEEFFNQYSDAINDVIDIVNQNQEDVDDLALTVTGAVIALTDEATPALDASLGSTFTLSATGNRTIAVPTNPTDGQRIVIVHYASGGARTLALNSGTGGFLFGTDITTLTETTSGKRDLIGCIYNTTLNKWCVVAYAKGF
jgi:hypothetical protein